MGLSPSDWYVYALFRPDTGTIFYIGMGRGKRAWEHQRDRRKGRSYKDNILCKVIDVLGYADVPVVMLRTGLTRSEAIDLEVALIYAIGRHPHGPLANIVRGGEGLSDPTPEFRLRHGRRMRRALADPAIRAVMSAKAKARPRTGEDWELRRIARMADPEVRAKMTAAAKLRVRDPEAEARRMAAVLSPESIAKRSAKLKGKPSPWKGKSPSPETREKMRQAKLGRAPWNKGKKTGQLPWTAGTTKATNPRLAAMAKSMIGNKRGAKKPSEVGN